MPRGYLLGYISLEVLSICIVDALLVDKADCCWFQGAFLVRNVVLPRELTSNSVGEDLLFTYNEFT